MQKGQLTYVIKSHSLSSFLSHASTTHNPSHKSFLIWSDVKKNRIYRWEEGGGFFTIGKSVYMEESGCRGNETLCKSLIEPGR